MPRTFQSYERHGFLITHSAGPDAPWRGWHESGASFRADTLRGAFIMARDYGAPRPAKPPAPPVWGNNWISATETHAGLLFQAGNNGRADLSDAYRAGGYQQAESVVLENIGGNGLEFIPPEYLGLTEMPAFSCGLTYGDDDGDDRQWDGEGAPVWGFPDYMLRDPWQELRSKGRVLFPIVSRS